MVGLGAVSGAIPRRGGRRPAGACPPRRCNLASKPAIGRTRKAKAEAVGSPQEQAVDFEQVAFRAYEIYESGEGGDSLENWLRAERELIDAAA